MDQTTLQTWTNALDGDARAARDLYEATGRVGGDPADVDVDAAWASVAAAVTAPAAKVVPLGTRSRPRHARYVRYAVAAAVAVVVLALVNVVAGLGEGASRFANATAEAMPVVLPDDTEAMLMPGSELRYAERDGRREVTVAGEVGFAVTHDPEMAFAVDAAELELIVVGTKFMVNRDGRAGVAVSEGHVRVRGRREADWTDIYAGGYVDVVDGLVAEVRERGAASDDLRFRERPLAEVLARLGAHHGVGLTAAAGLRGCRLTANLADASLAEAVETIALTLGARAEPDGDGGFALSGGGCR